MANIIDPQNGLRRQAGDIIGRNAEKFMGAADQVPRPALPGAAAGGGVAQVAAPAQAGLSTVRPTPAPGMGINPEKFMGAADQVPRPALPAGQPAPAGPGRANLMGSGSAPIGTGYKDAAGGAAEAASGGSGLVQGARALINGALGKVVAGGAAVQSIGDSMAGDSTDRYAKRFGVAAPVGDGSAGDIARFVGLRAGGFASDLANNLTFGLAGKLYNDNPGAATPGTPAAAAGAAPGAAQAASAAPTTVQPEKLAGSPLYGAEGVRRVDTPQGPLYTNATSNAQDAAFMASRGSVSQAGNPADLASMRRAGDLQAQISLERAGLRDRGDPTAYLRNAGQVASLSAGGVSSELQGQIDKLAKAKNLSVGGVQALSALTQNRNQVAQNQAELAERARQADQNADVSLRGQDVTARGQDMSARTAANAARIQQLNNDRDFGLKSKEYGLRTQEFGAKREQENFSQREEAAKNLTSRYESQFTTTDKDGKQIVDKARAAKYALGVQQFVGTRQAELQQLVESGKASPQEAAALDRLRTKGVAALDAEDLATIQSQMALGERAEQSSSAFGLFGGRAVSSSNPGDFQVVGRKQNLFGSDTLQLKGGGTIRENDALYNEPGNALLPDTFKRRTTDFDLAKGLRK